MESVISLDKLNEWRNGFHQFPEVMWTEYRTTARIAYICMSEFGIPLENIYLGDRLHSLDRSALSERNLTSQSLTDELFESGLKTDFGLKDKPRIDGYVDLVSQLRGMRNGQTGLIVHFPSDFPDRDRFSFRCDIDALPICESDASEHSPTAKGFKSQIPGRMHACGHDGHTAVGLAVCKCLSVHKRLNDTFVLFQPAEEGGNGGGVFAKIVLALDSSLHKSGKISRFVALHVGLIERRSIVCGTEFLSGAFADVTFHGVSAHAGVNPQDGRNALLAAAQAVVGLYSLARFGDFATRVNVGMFSTTNAHNVICDRAFFKFEVRGANNEVRDQMYERALAVLRGAASMYDVTVDIVRKRGMMSWRSDEEVIQELREAAIASGIPAERIEDRVLATCSEDAPRIQKVISNAGGKQAFICLGCKTRGGHHNPLFDFDTETMLEGIRIFVEFIKAHDKLR